MEKNKIIEILKDNNIRVTENRINILNCLADDTHFHTVAQIEKHLKDVNTKSIYNNIKLLVSSGIVDTFSFGGISKYAINDHFRNRHNVVHVIEEDDTIKHIEIEEQIIEDIKETINKKGYDPTSVNIFVNIKK